MDNRYSRQHVLRFDGGAEVAGSSSPHVVTLRPDVQFSGDHLPTRAQLDAIHHAAHADCFIANSVKTQVLYEPVYVALG